MCAISALFTYFKPYELCEGYVDDLRNGIIPRTFLLAARQTIKTLAHGTYNVTGSIIQTDNLGNGSVTKIIGIAVNGHNPLPHYNPGNQPFNLNFAFVLFEAREADQAKISHSVLDYVWANNRHNVNNYNSTFINNYIASINMPPAGFGEVSISDKLINGIAR